MSRLRRRERARGGWRTKGKRNETSGATQPEMQPTTHEDQEHKVVNMSRGRRRGGGGGEEVRLAGEQEEEEVIVRLDSVHGLMD